MKLNHKISQKVIERLSIYRRILNIELQRGNQYIFSHDLAKMNNSSSAQVRRDLMVIGLSGIPRKGYEIAALCKEIQLFLEAPRLQQIALVGIGNIGRALLTYFLGRYDKIAITAAFDVDPEKINRTIYGCQTYHINNLQDIVLQNRIKIGIITVPENFAQRVANQLIDSGVKSIINWAPVALHVPENIFIENRDIAVAVEKAAYYSKIN